MSAHDVVVFGEGRCHKVQYYLDALRERGVAHEFADTEASAEAAARLAQLYDGELKFPTLLIKGRKVRNPSDRELDKELARADLYDPGLVHEEKSQRYVRYMRPTDAFVSYTHAGDALVLGHIQVDPALRGRGIARELANEVFQEVSALDRPVTLTCPYLRKVASEDPRWRETFNL